MRRPGIEPGSQEWESCMIPLHQRRHVSNKLNFNNSLPARLAQSVEHETLNLRVVGSSPTLGAIVLAKILASLMKQNCRDPGSNRGPLDLQSNALPTELSRL